MKNWDKVLVEAWGKVNHKPHADEIIVELPTMMTGDGWPAKLTENQKANVVYRLLKRQALRRGEEVTHCSIIEYNFSVAAYDCEAEKLDDKPLLLTEEEDEALTDEMNRLVATFHAR